MLGLGEKRVRLEDLPPSSVARPQSGEEQLDDLERRANPKMLNRTGKSTRRKKNHYAIGGCAAVFAAFAGATSLSSWFGTFGDDVAGVSALVSGILTSVVGSYDFGRRAARPAVEKAEWFSFLTEIRALQSGSSLVDPVERPDRVEALLVQERELWRADAAARGA